MSTNDFKVAGECSALSACQICYKMTNTVVQFIYSHILKFYQNGTYTQTRVAESFSGAIGQPVIKQRFTLSNFLLCIVSRSKNILQYAFIFKCFTVNLFYLYYIKIPFKRFINYSMLCSQHVKSFAPEYDNILHKVVYAIWSKF